MDTSLVMRYFGRNYTAAHRNVHNSIRRISPYIDHNLLQHYQSVMTTGCPNVFNADCSWSNFITYWQHGNNPSIMKKLDAVMKTMNKEERNNFVILLLAWIAQFTPHIFLTAQHNLIKEDWKDLLIFNAAKQPTMDTIPINLMTSTKDGMELNCTFGTVMTDFLTHLWNLRITFPDCDITIHANKTKSCFRQLKHHPDVMGAFSFVIDTIIFLQCRLTFGSDFSLANWEPIRLIAEQLAMALFKNKTLQEKHKHHLNKLQWDNSLGNHK